MADLLTGQTCLLLNNTAINMNTRLSAVWLRVGKFCPAATAWNFFSFSIICPSVRRNMSVSKTKGKHLQSSLCQPAA